MLKPKLMRNAVFGLAVAALGAGVANAADKFEFVFLHYDHELENTARAELLYSRLLKEAGEACEAAGMSEPALACRDVTVERVVAGLDNRNLTRVHEISDDVSQAAKDVPYFLFELDDRGFDSFTQTRKIYDRLRSQAIEYCADTREGSKVEDCANSIVDRTVSAIDDYGLSHRHGEVARKGSVYIVD